MNFIQRRSVANIHDFLEVAQTSLAVRSGP